MKIAAAILFGCIIIAIAIYFGLTYDKRTFMEACVEGKIAPDLNCDKTWLLYRK